MIKNQKALSLLESISRAKTLDELESVLRNHEGFKHENYRNYIYPTFGGEAVGPNDVSYFKAYEDGLDISSMCFDILSWDKERILFIIGIGMTLDIVKDQLVEVNEVLPDEYEFIITEREFVLKYSVDIICPYCNQINRILPDYSVEKCEHAVASHVYGHITWHNQEIQKSIEGFESELKPIISSNVIDDSIPEEDENGARNYWSFFEDVVSAIKSLYPAAFFKEDAAYGLGYCDDAGFAFLPSEVLSNYHS